MFKTPEIAARFGALDDEAFADGEPVSAHELREMARNANLLLSRGGLIFRAVFDANTAGELEGAAVSFAPPYWQHMIPAPAVSARKKYGITSMRVRFRLIVDSGRVVHLFVGTAARPSPAGQPLSAFITVTGTGSTQVVDATVPVREAADELLSFYFRAVVDPSSDTLMATGTYGTQNTGVVDTSTQFSFTDTGSAWNTSGANMPNKGGHYVYFTDAAGNTPVHGPAEIRGVRSATELEFYPPISDGRFITGSTFFIRKLPAVRLLSIACYGVDRSV